jgi:hypothetical protein
MAGHGVIRSRGAFSPLAVYGYDKHALPPRGAEVKDQAPSRGWSDATELDEKTCCGQGQQADAIGRVSRD